MKKKKTTHIVCSEARCLKNKIRQMLAIYASAKNQTEFCIITCLLLHHAYIPLTPSQTQLNLWHLHPLPPATHPTNIICWEISNDKQWHKFIITIYQYFQHTCHFDVHKISSTNILPVVPITKLKIKVEKLYQNYEHFVLFYTGYT